MKTLLLVFLFSSSALAEDAAQWGDPHWGGGGGAHGRIVHSPPEEDHPYHGLEREVGGAMRVHSAKMVEDSLVGKADHGCFLRTTCAVGTVDDEVDVPEYSMAMGILNFRTLLQNVASEVEGGLDADLYPNIKKVLASFAVGSSTSNLNLCDQLFACDMPAVSALEESLNTRHPDDFSVPASAEVRTTCAATGVLCPGVSISCALCGVFAPPGTCGSQCIIAGLYCGTSAYACMAQAAQAEEVDNPRRRKNKYVVASARMSDLKDSERRYRQYMEAVFNRRF